MNFKIGCTGWSYQGWSGTFYPKNLKSSEWLKYYSQIFEITEINSTFYRIPSQEIVKRWNTDSPRHFRFTAKFPSIITHEKRLDRVNSEVFSFLASLSPIHDKVSALVLQLPPSLSFEEAKPRLEEFFETQDTELLLGRPIEAKGSPMATLPWPTSAEANGSRASAASTWPALNCSTVAGGGTWTPSIESGSIPSCWAQ